MTYTVSSESVSVVWEDYRDDESGIKFFKLRLLEAASCDVEDGDNLTVVHGQDWLILGPDIRQFTLVDLSLEVGLFNSHTSCSVKMLPLSGVFIQTFHFSLDLDRYF